MMYRNSCYFKMFVSVLIGILLLVKNQTPIYALEFLTQEEADYIGQKNIIKAGSMNGVAPLAYIDNNGEIQGISKRVLEEVSKMTGLIFEYKLYDSVEEIQNSDTDVFFGISKTYSHEGIILTEPFLKTETILYINSKLDSDKLDNKIYSATLGDKLPEGVEEKNVLYFKTREQSLDAVEKGKADFGYGNAYSVAFYTLQNGYKNIITIPKGHTAREYCMGVSEENKVLFSIINKSIGRIDENQIQNIILDITSHVERKITFKMIMDTYGGWVVTIFSTVIVILLYSLITNRQVNIKLNIQSKKYELLSRTDRLTGLYNAITTRELICENIKNKDDNVIDAFIIIDCDKFKDINDTYGHLVGDQVLVNVSKALKCIFGDKNIIGRMGGDEFAVYLKDATSEKLVRQSCQEFNNILQELSKDFQVSASIGVVLFNEEVQYKELFKQADDAMYEAKK